MMSETDGTIKERLGRVEDGLRGVGEKVDDLSMKVSGLQQAEDRRYTDRLLPNRVRDLEDWRIAMETRDRTITAVLTKVFGVSVVGAAASILAIIVGIVALAQGGAV